MNPAHRKTLFRLVIALFVCLLLEGVCFNYTALKTRSLKAFPVPVENTAGTEFTFEPAKMEGIKTIRLVFAGAQPLTTVRVFLKDDSHKYVFVEANEVQISAGSAGFNDVVLKYAPHGYLYGISVRWDNEQVRLTELELNAPVPYRFFVKRFLLLFVIAAFVLFSREYRLWEIIYDAENKRHVLCYAGTALLCMVFSVYLTAQLKPYDITQFPWAQQIAYPLAEPPETYEQLPHVLLFDAVYNGVPYIRVTPDERLATLENPYDYSQKEAAGMHYAEWWDYAYYNGRYYVYFGVAPVLLFYFPYYFLTGVLPSYVQCSLFFALLSIAGGFLCFHALARRYAGKISLLMLCLMSAAAVLGSQVYMLQSCPNRYHISIAAEQAFFFLAVWAAVAALGAGVRIADGAAEKPVEGVASRTGGGVKKRRVFLACSAVFTALMIASRPSAAFILAGWLVVLFMTVLLEKERARAEKIKDAAAYLVPVLLLGACIMAYNYTRFESPFEFGVSYIMSVWDVIPNRPDVTAIPKAVIHYGFEPMRLSADFPWFRLDNAYVNHTGNFHYVNADGNAGAFVVPVTWGCFAYLLSGKDGRAAGRRAKEWKILFIVTLVTAALTMWMNHSLGGTSERYVIDVQAALSLSGGVCLLRRGEYKGAVLLYASGEGTAESGKTEPLYGAVYRMIILICVLTMIMSVCRAFSNEVNAISRYAPARYLTFVRMFSLP